MINEELQLLNEMAEDVKLISDTLEKLINEKQTMMDIAENSDGFTQEDKSDHQNDFEDAVFHFNNYCNNLAFDRKKWLKSHENMTKPQKSELFETMGKALRPDPESTFDYKNRTIINFYQDLH